jgi:LPS export ABC transporter protein LptC/lipopolysaccharide transport protein LptA
MMRLERLFIHRLIRALRLLLPIVVLALAAVPTWNYLARRVQHPESVRRALQMPRDVSVHTEGFTFSRTAGGKTLFTVHAKSNLGFKDNKGVLEDVDVIVNPATANEPPKTIRGKKCTYDQQTNDFQFDGDVVVQLDEKTIVHTEQLIYSHRDASVVSPGPATVEQLGSTGRGDHVEYGLETGLLKLSGNVKVQTAEHAELQADSALFQQKENWATLNGNVFIKSSTGWIRGAAGRAQLQPETFKPKIITIEGNVTAESQGQSAHDVFKTAGAWLEATMGSNGNAERVKTRGDVVLEKITGDAQQRLSGEEIDAKLNETGRVEIIEARQNARMIFGSDQTLESNEIHSDAAGSVQTFDASVLKVGDSTIRGREFAIQDNEDVVTFSTSRRADLKSEDRLSSADKTSARFDGRTNMLLDLVQTGNFQFRDPQYQGHAASAKFEDGGKIVILDGSPVVTDAEKRLEAAQIRLNQNDNSFTATKNVNILMKNSDQQVLIRAGRGEGNSDSMSYAGNVQLWRGDAYIRADRLESYGQDKESMRVHAEGGVQSILQAVRANSEKLDYDDTMGIAHYQGKVRAQKDNMIIESPDVTVNFQDQDVTQLTASGGVKATRSGQYGTGDHAVYEAATDAITLTGKNAQVRDKEHGLIQGARLIMTKNGETVSVEGGNGDRTLTQHPVTNDKKPSTSPIPAGRSRNSNK